MSQSTVVPKSREQLWSLLAEAAEIEHHLMCCYLYAAFSLKEHADEGLSADELTAVQRWRGEILGVAIEEMGHLATVCNILSSIGAPAHFAHQNFPVSPGYHPAGVVVKLTPFNPDTLAHFIYLERPGNAAIEDGKGFEPPRHYARDSGMERLMTVATDYTTVGQLYATISAGLAAVAGLLGEDRLFLGNPAHQLGSDVCRLPGIKVVRCLRTALEAIDAVVLQGEGADVAQSQSHYQRFLVIEREYHLALAARADFRPARMSAHNPVMRRPPTPEGKLWITEEPAASLLDLGNALYNHCLRCLSLAYGGVDPAIQRVLVQTSIDLMRLLTPLASRLGTLPANPVLPQATAGLSFATLRSSAALTADVESVQILVERLHDMQQRAVELSKHFVELEGILAEAAHGLARLAERLMRSATLIREATSPAVPTGAVVTVVPTTLSRPATDVVATTASDRGPPPPIALGNGSERIPGPAIDLIYNGKRCIHARHCVLGLPKVFIANIEGPWIAPGAASTEQLVTVAQMCPSGAIQYQRHDGGAEEATPAVNLVQLRENGPLGVRAEIVLDGEPIGMRAVLCRCGASKNKPFCDGSHNAIAFEATGEPATIGSTPLATRNGPLAIDPQINGPLVVTGNLEVCCGTGRTINRVTATRLCRCGGSANKPFCDGTHARIDFRSEA